MTVIKSKTPELGGVVTVFDDPTHTCPSTLGLKKEEYISSIEEIKGYLKKEDWKYVKEFLHRHHTGSIETQKLDSQTVDIIAPYIEQKAELIVPLLWTGCSTSLLIASINNLQSKMNEAAYRNAIKKVWKKPQQIHRDLQQICYNLYTVAKNRCNK